MVNIKLFIAIPVLITASACTYTPARTVKQVSIDVAGISIESEERNTAALCKKFQPTVPQLKEYFNHAYPAEGYVMTTNRYSPCYASGNVEFDDNSQGQWALYSGGAAFLTFSNGDYVILSHKNNKWIDPTACTYGLGDQGEC